MIGIVVPMPEEIALILQHMQVEEVIEVAKRKFYKGTIEGTPCVVVLSRIGKVASSVTAAILIERFQPNALIVTGVAGGLTEEVKIGDVVVATSAVQHDMNCEPLFPKGEIPLLGIKTFQLNEKLSTKVYSLTQEFLSNEYPGSDLEKHANELGITNPIAHKGLLLSGDQFIGTLEHSNQIKNENPDALFVEMEGAAVAQVCYEYGIDLICIRSISDNACSVAHIDFDLYIREVARHYTWLLIKKILKNIGTH
jgi:adenosylhomocysteine nucleosidase